MLILSSSFASPRSVWRPLLLLVAASWLPHAGAVTFTRLTGPVFRGNVPAISRGQVALLGASNSVWVVNASGNGAVQVLPNGAAIPSDTPSVPYANSQFSPATIPAGDTFQIGGGSQLRIGGGYVVFVGTEPSGRTTGLYSVPAGGGPVTTLASGQYFPLDFQVSDTGQVVFTYGQQVYTVPAAGGPIVTLAANAAYAPPSLVVNSGSTMQAGLYGYPAISGSNVVLNAGHPVAGGSIQTTSLNSPGSLTDIADGRQFDVYSFDTVMKIDGGTVVFYAQNHNGSVQGIYAASGPGQVVTLADSTIPAPGGSGTFRFGGNGHGPMLAASDGIVVFEANDAAGNTGIYEVSESGGPVSKILAVGDPFGSSTVMNLDMGAESLSGGKLVLQIAYDFDWHVYVADLTSSASLQAFAGGPPNTPVPLPAGDQPINQVQTDIGTSGPQNFYQFSWPGGWFTADALITGADPNDSYSLQLFAPDGTPLSNAPLDAPHSFSGTVAQPLDPGTYAIGLACTGPCAGGSVTLNFDTPVSGVPAGSGSSASVVTRRR